MSGKVSHVLSCVGILVVFGSQLPLLSADAFSTLTLIYSGEEQGQLALHGCGAEQVGGLSRRHTVIQSLRQKHANTLNLHTGNILSPTDPNNELIYQIALEALGEMNYDAIFIGPQDLCLSVDSLQALHASHPNLPVVCTNVFYPNTVSFAPYSLKNTPSQIEVALIGLISKSHKTEVTAYNSGMILTSPEEALNALEGEITAKGDVVLGVFHGTEDEARGLAERFPWLDVLILAGNESTNTSSPTIVRNTAIVTNAPKGEAVGVLEIGLDDHLRVVSRQGYRVEVSEKIAPDENLETLLALYHSLSEDDGLRSNDGVPDDSAIHITYFHKRGCQKCTRANDILKRLKTEYPQVVVEMKYAKENRELLEAMGALYNVPQVKRLTTPAVFIGVEYLLDELDEAHLKTVVGKYLSTGVASRLPEAEGKTGDAESEIVKRFSAFGTLAVAGAGLLDGINPCAFATIVFFISYMSLVGRERKEMLIAGGAFAAAVLTTYLLMGMGLLKFLSFLNEFSVIAKCVYLLAAIGTFTLAFFSLYDAVKAKQGKVKEITLQLPKSLKLRIHKVIREQTRTSGVVIGAVVIGFAISALELVCTGQVYLPTITFVMGVEGMRANALSYLVLYNLMFITPLVVVFGFVYWGTTSIQLGGVLQQYLMPAKIGTGAVLLGLGVWLLMYTI